MRLLIDPRKRYTDDTINLCYQKFDAASAGLPLLAFLGAAA
jgi:hypothetical protein